MAPDEERFLHWHSVRTLIFVSMVATSILIPITRYPGFKGRRDAFAIALAQLRLELLSTPNEEHARVIISESRISIIRLLEKVVSNETIVSRGRAPG